MIEHQLHNRRTLWSHGLVVTGIAIAVLNMALAWTMLFLGPTPQGGAKSTPPAQVSEVTPPSGVEQGAKRQAPSSPSQPVPGLSDSPGSSNVMVAKLFDMYLSSSQSEERRTTLLLGFCFALMSIGFSLFVMGIEGVADLKGDAKELGSLAIKVSSPGILCICLSALVLALGIGGLARSSPIQPIESKADAVRAEFEGKEQVLRAEAQSKEDQIRAEADAKERVIDAETRAKRELIDAETEAKERLYRLDSVPRPKR